MLEPGWVDYADRLLCVDQKHGQAVRVGAGRFHAEVDGLGIQEAGSKAVDPTKELGIAGRRILKYFRRFTVLGRLMNLKGLVVVASMLVFVLDLANRQKTCGKGLRCDICSHPRRHPESGLRVLSLHLCAWRPLFNLG